MRSTECRSSKGVFIATQLNSIQLTQLNSVQPSQSCFFMTNLQIESTGSLRSLTVVHVELLRRDTFFLQLCILYVNRAPGKARK